MVKDTIGKYRALQDLDTKLQNIADKLGAIPVMLKDSFEGYEKAESETKICAEKLEKQKNSLIKLSTDIESQNSMLENAQKKLASVKNSKEYQAALKEIDIVKKKVNDESQKQNALKEEVKMLEESFSELTATADELKTSYVEKKQKLEDENKDLFTRQQTLIQTREDTAKTIKNSVLSKYDKVRQARGNLAITPMQEGVCRGCFMKLTPQMVVNVKKELDLYQCPHCQRFLYYVEVEKEDKENTEK